MNYEQICANCKWEVVAVIDHEGIPRCSDCGSEIEGYEMEENDADS